MGDEGGIGALNDPELEPLGREVTSGLADQIEATHGSARDALLRA